MMAPSRVIPLLAMGHVGWDLTLRDCAGSTGLNNQEACFFICKMGVPSKPPQR